MIAYCKTCADKVILKSNGSGACSWCDTIVIEPPRVGGPQGARMMTEEQIVQAHRRHVDGASIRSIAGQLLPDTGYRSAKTIVEALRNEWTQRGWYIRPRIEASIAASTVHGRMRRDNRDPQLRAGQRRASGGVADMPLCAGHRTQYPRKGQPCQTRARVGSAYCHQHDPALAERRREHLQQARQRIAR